MSNYNSANTRREGDVGQYGFREGQIEGQEEVPEPGLTESERVSNPPKQPSQSQTSREWHEQAAKNVRDSRQGNSR